MALPIVDGTTAASAATVNKFMYGDGTQDGIVCLAFRIYYDGADWQVSAAGTGFNANIRNALEAGLTWHASDYLVVDLSSMDAYVVPFASTPVVVCGTVAVSSNRNMVADAVPIDSDTIRIFWYDQTAATQETTESTSMDCSIILYGTTA